MSWNDERVERLSKLWLEGRSASQIAAELGQGVTRNAVIGKVHRLGLSGRVKLPTPGAQARTRPRIPSKSEGLAIVAEAPLEVVEHALAPPPRKLADVVIPFSSRVTIMELRDTMCRWPLGDPTSADFRFCGHRSGPVGPYCAEHAQLAFQPTQERRRVERIARIA